MEINKIYSEWLNNAPVFTLENGDVLFTESSMKSFVRSFKKKIEETNNISIDSDEELQKFFFDIFIKEASEQRGIVGRYSIVLSKKNVIGVVLAIASLVDVFISGVITRSILISSGGLISALTSAISKLTKEELEVIGLITLLQSEIQASPTVEVLLNSGEHKREDLLKILHSLVNKDAIEWNGDTTAQVKLKKWM